MQGNDRGWSSWCLADVYSEFKDIEHKWAELLKDSQKKADTEQETQDNLIQDLERYDRTIEY